jgi:hypothetical protein
MVSSICQNSVQTFAHWSVKQCNTVTSCMLCRPMDFGGRHWDSSTVLISNTESKIFCFLTY